MISCEDVFGRAGSERLGLHSTIVTIESGEALSEHLPVALRSVDFEPMFQRCSSIAEWVATKPDAAASLVVVIQTPHGNASDLGESIAALKQYSAHPQFVIMSVSDEPGCVLEALLQGALGFIPMDLPCLVVAQALKLICFGGVFVPQSSLRVLASAGELPKLPAMLGKVFLSAHELAAADPLVQAVSEKPQHPQMQRSDVKFHVRRLLGKLKARSAAKVAHATRGALHGNGESAEQPH